MQTINELQEILLNTLSKEDLIKVITILLKKISYDSKTIKYLETVEFAYSDVISDNEETNNKIENLLDNIISQNENIYVWNSELEGFKISSQDDINLIKFIKLLISPITDNIEDIITYGKN